MNYGAQRWIEKREALALKRIEMQESIHVLKILLHDLTQQNYELSVIRPKVNTRIVQAIDNITYENQQRMRNANVTLGKCLDTLLEVEINLRNIRRIGGKHAKQRATS